MLSHQLEVILSEENESNSEPSTKRHHKTTNQNNKQKENIERIQNAKLQNYEEQLVNQIKMETVNQHNTRYQIDSEKAQAHLETIILKNSQLEKNRIIFQKQKEKLQIEYDTSIKDTNSKQKLEFVENPTILQQMQILREKQSQIDQLQANAEKLKQMQIPDENFDSNILLRLRNQLEFINQPKLNQMDPILKIVELLSIYFKDKSSQEKLGELSQILKVQPFQIEAKRKALQIIMSFNMPSKQVSGPDQEIFQYKSPDFALKYQFKSEMSSQQLSEKIQINKVLSDQQKSYSKLKSDLVMEKLKYNKLSYVR